MMWLLQASSIEDKHVELVEGIFNYFAEAYGTKKKMSCKKRQRKIASKLRKVKEMKNDARELAIAKRANFLLRTNYVFSLKIFSVCACT